MSNIPKSSKSKYNEFLKSNGLFSKRSKDSNESKKSKDNRGGNLRFYLFRSLSEFRKQSGGKLFFAVILSILSTGIGVIIPWTSKVMIDNILPRKDVKLLIWVCVGLFIVAIFRFLISLLYDFYIQRIVGRFAINLKKRVMNHLHSLPLVELQKLKTGGAITRLQEDTEGAANLIQHGLLTPFNALLMFAFSITSLLIVSWQTTIVALLFIVFMFGVAYCFFYLMRPFQRSIREDLSRINGNLTENFSGIEVVKSFSREKSIAMNYMKDTHFLWRKTLYTLLIGISVRRGIWALHFIASIAIWLVGGYLYIQGNLTIGDVVVFISFLLWIFQPVFMIMGAFTETQRSVACMERTVDLLEIKPDILENDKATDCNTFKDGIKFQNVSFKYPDGTVALDDITFNIPKGKVTALVGASGSGKTTITSLVLRFYKETEGNILLDNKNIRDITLASYRNLMSLVIQDVFLFDGTIYDNILFGKRDATKSEVEAVAKIAHCEEFIQKLENKYETFVGERGIKLSGGQKQRLALARALLADPQLLILDEATSNLDSESESLIQDALHHIFHTRTTLVIAHRLSTIVDADNIIVMGDGKIVEQGTHNNLIAEKGKYYDMFMKQVGGVDLFSNSSDLNIHSVKRKDSNNFQSKGLNSLIV